MGIVYLTCNVDSSAKFASHNDFLKFMQGALITSEKMSATPIFTQITTFLPQIIIMTLRSD